MEKLAIQGGTPVRRQLLPIFRLSLDTNELDSLVAVARSGQLSRGQGPIALEKSLCKLLGVAHAVVLSSGTAALHLALKSLEIQPGSEVILPSLTFVATAWAVEYCGLVPRFCEIDPTTYNVTAETMESQLSPRTRVLLPVHYGGQAAPMAGIHALAKAHGLHIVEDAAHAMGAVYTEAGLEEPEPVGSCRFGDLTTFSFFATKNITGGEGGLVTTNDSSLAKSIRQARGFGLQPHCSSKPIPGWYDAVSLGFNYHLSNLNIALIREQLPKLEILNKKRCQIAAALTEGLKDVPGIAHLPESNWPNHVYHLYTIQIDLSALRASRLEIAKALYAEGIQVGFYYPPVHLFSYFREKYGWRRGSLPVTEQVTDSLLTLPMYPLLTQRDVDDITTAVRKVLEHYYSHR